MLDYQLAECPLVTRATSGTRPKRRAMTGRNLLSACPRAEVRGRAGRPAGLCDPLDDRSPDSRIHAERQGLPMPARPCGRVASLAGAKLPRRIRCAQHSDRRPSAPVCRPLPAYSGGTVWDSHPLPGIVGSRAVGGSIAPLHLFHRPPAPAARHRSGPRPSSRAPSVHRVTCATAPVPTARHRSGPRPGSRAPSAHRVTCATAPAPRARHRSGPRPGSRAPSAHRVTCATALAARAMRDSHAGTPPPEAPQTRSPFRWETRSRPLG